MFAPCEMAIFFRVGALFIAFFFFFFWHPTTVALIHHPLAGFYGAKLRFLSPFLIAYGKVTEIMARARLVTFSQPLEKWLWKLRKKSEITFFIDFFLCSAGWKVQMEFITQKALFRVTARSSSFNLWRDGKKVFRLTEKAYWADAEGETRASTVEAWKQA